MNSSVLVYSVNEVATALNVHPNSVYNWTKEGRLPAVRLGRKVVIPKASLERLLAGGSASAQ